MGRGGGEAALQVPDLGGVATADQRIALEGEDDARDCRYSEAIQERALDRLGSWSQPDRHARFLQARSEGGWINRGAGSEKVLLLLVGEPAALLGAGPLLFCLVVQPRVYRALHALEERHVLPQALLPQHHVQRLNQGGALGVGQPVGLHFPAPPRMERDVGPEGAGIDAVSGLVLDVDPVGAPVQRQGELQALQAQAAVRRSRYVPADPRRGPFPCNPCALHAQRSSNSNVTSQSHHDTSCLRLCLLAFVSAERQAGLAVSQAHHGASQCMINNRDENTDVGSANDG